MTEGLIDLGLLDHIVLVVRPISPWHQCLGDPPTVDPYCVVTTAIAVVKGSSSVIVLHDQGGQDVKALRARLHARGRRGLFGILGAQTAHGHLDPGWGTARPN